MANILDYLTWRGDLTLTAVPWTPIDALLLANLSYNDLPDAAATEQGALLTDIAADMEEASAPDGSVYDAQWHQLIFIMADTVRFGHIRLHDFINTVDDARGIQFSAVTADLPDGQRCVCFRGTDSSLVGWREDFTMAFESPVPAQMEAVTYLERAAIQAPGGLYVVGHSKGGNLAAYAAAHASPVTQKQLVSVYSFDGPGLDTDTMASPGYARIRPVLHAVIPQSSVVGLLITDHPDYTVVRSDAAGLLQHDSFSWQLIGPRFDELGEVDAASRVIDDTLHEWLKQSTPDQRRAFVETIFSILEATGADTLSDISAEKLKSAAAMLAAARDIDPETARMIARMIGQLLTIGAGNVLGEVLKHPIHFLRDALHPDNTQHKLEE